MSPTTRIFMLAFMAAFVAVIAVAGEEVFSD